MLPLAFSKAIGWGGVRRVRARTGALKGRLVVTVLVAGLGLWCWSPTARAAGFWISEMGTPDLGTASAGRAAMAKDAATVFGNPAGMTKLESSEVLVGAQVVVGDIEFDRGSGTTVAGGNGGNASGVLPGGSLYYVHDISPDFKLGGWHGSYFGGSVDYNDGWSGRYYGTEAEILTLGAGINGAYKVNDWLSIGGGPFLLYGKLDQKVAVNSPLESDADGRLKFSDGDVGFGGMAGLMLEPWPGSRFGINYTSPVKLNFKDVPSTGALGPGLQFLQDERGLLDRKTDLGLTVPQQVMLSAYHQVTDRLAVMGNLVWQDWSEFGKPDVSVESTEIDDLTVDLDYDDTWGVAFGVQYALTDRWLWSVGAGYDTSPMSKSQRSPNLPLDRQIRVGSGIQYSLKDNITVGFAYQYMNGGKADMDVDRGPLSGRVEGDYDTYDVHFFALNLSWRL